MWIKNGTRRDLLDVLKSKESLNRSELMPWKQTQPLPVNPGELQFVWEADPTSHRALPSAVLVNPENQRDFLAWTSTYLASLRPLTAYCRVVDVTTANIFLQRFDAPTLGDLENACLGLILGEAATYLEGKRDLRQLSPSACANTCSFAMARALSFGVLSKAFDPISNGWSIARALTKQPNLRIGWEDLRVPWAILVSLQSKGAEPAKLPTALKSLADACWDVYATGEIQAPHWNSLVGEMTELTNLRGQMVGPREDRVVLVEKALSLLQEYRPRNEAIENFLCGYLVSQVGPGTIDHISLLGPYLKSFPSAALWYGFCAGLLKDSTIQIYGGGLGQRVLREVLRNESFLDRPRCDVSIAEMEVLLSSESPTLDLRTGTKGQLEIELVPCVTTTVRWPARTESQAELFQEQLLSKEGRNLLREFDEALRRMSLVQRDIARAVGVGQNSFDFPRRGRKKGRSS